MKGYLIAGMAALAVLICATGYSDTVIRDNGEKIEGEARLFGRFVEIETADGEEYILYKHKVKEAIVDGEPLFEPEEEKEGYTGIMIGTILYPGETARMRRDQQEGGYGEMGEGMFGSGMGMGGMGYGGGMMPGEGGMGYGGEGGMGYGGPSGGGMGYGGPSGGGMGYGGEGGMGYGGPSGGGMGYGGPSGGGMGYGGPSGGGMGYGGPSGGGMGYGGPSGGGQDRRYR